MYRNKDRTFTKQSMVGGRIVYKTKVVRGGMIFDINPKQKDTMNRFNPLPWKPIFYQQQQQQKPPVNRSADAITRSLGGMILGKSGGSRKRVGKGITLI